MSNQALNDIYCMQQIIINFIIIIINIIIIIIININYT